MSTAFLLLATAIALTPEILIAHGMITYGLMLAIVATGIALVGVNFQHREIDQFRKLISPLPVLVAPVGAWMILQVLPLPGSWISHPIWVSAAAALGGSLPARVSIDVGTTVLALAHYLCFIGTIVLAAAISIDRRRAELLSMWWSEPLVSSAVRSSRTSWHLGKCWRNSSVLSSTSAALDRWLSGYWQRWARFSCTRAAAVPEFHKIAGAPSLTLALSVIAFTICLAGILIARERTVLFAAAYGALTPIVVTVVRRAGVNRWGYLGVATIATVCALFFIVATPNFRAPEPTLALAAGPVGATERILPDVPWTGTGAGTFRALLPIYAEASPESVHEQQPPTAGAELLVELGRPMLFIIIGLVGFGIYRLLDCSLQRHRDAFYAAMGAGLLIECLILSFHNPSLFHPAISSLTGVILGLAIGQSKSSLASTEMFERPSFVPQH